MIVSQTFFLLLFSLVSLSAKWDFIHVLVFYFLFSIFSEQLSRILPKFRGYFIFPCFGGRQTEFDYSFLVPFVCPYFLSNQMGIFIAITCFLSLCHVFSVD